MTMIGPPSVADWATEMKERPPPFSTSPDTRDQWTNSIQQLSGLSLVNQESSRSSPETARPRSLDRWRGDDGGLVDPTWGCCLSFWLHPSLPYGHGKVSFSRCSWILQDKKWQKCQDPGTAGFLATKLPTSSVTFLLAVGISISHFSNEDSKAQRGQWILFQVTALLRDRVRIGMQMSLTSQPPFFPLSWRWDLKDTDGLWIIEARGAMLTLSYPQRSTEISHTHTHTICCCHIPNVITPAEKHQAFSWRNFFLC